MCVFLRDASEVSRTRLDNSWRKLARSATLGPRPAKAHASLVLFVSVRAEHRRILCKPCILAFHRGVTSLPFDTPLRLVANPKFVWVPGITMKVNPSALLPYTLLYFATDFA